MSFRTRFVNNYFFLLLCQVTTSGQCQLRDKKHQYFSSVSLPTDSVIVDHTIEFSKAKTKNVTHRNKEKKTQKKNERFILIRLFFFMLKCCHFREKNRSHNGAKSMTSVCQICTFYSNLV
jgi:hypothetical protein